MNRLWSYQNYVEHLGHPSSFVRSWAFKAIERQFPRKVTKEVSKLIGDPDEHLACSAPRYLASHGATEFAPDIIESFKQGKDNVPSNCAMALGDLRYVPALDDILARLSNVESLNTFLGILHYLGKVRIDDCRQVLIKLLDESADNHFVEMVAYHLLEHGNSQDIPRVLEIYLGQLKTDHLNDLFLKRLMSSLGAEDLFDELTGYSQINILESPLKVLEEKIRDRSGIKFAQEPIDEIVRLIQKGDYQSVCTTLMFEAQNVVRKRFSDNKPTDSEYLSRIFELDNLNLSFLRELSKQSSHWKRARQNKEIGRDNLAAIISSYFSIIEREGYFEVLDSGDFSVESLISILQNASKKFPEILLNRLVGLAPIKELKSALSDELSTWGDIWIVRSMGKIGNEEFVSDLIRVVRETDGMAYIHSDAISALNGIDESGHESILSAIADEVIKDPFDVFELLEYLPYPESFDHALQTWIDDSDDSLDSYDIYAVCLERIGDGRGIEALQGIMFEGNVNYVGDSLETLCALHKREIPELAIIRKERKVKAERQRKRIMELDDLAKKASKREISNAGTQASNAKTFKRNKPKVGRNDPCPCGSGKKYKKCCLNKK